MQLIVCPDCASEINSTADVCFHCARPMSDRNTEAFMEYQKTFQKVETFQHDYATDRINLNEYFEKIKPFTTRRKELRKQLSHPVLV